MTNFNSDSERLIHILEMLGITYRSYSGRDMYGRYCIAVVANDVKWISKIILEAARLFSADELIEFSSQICNYSSDNMGLNTVYYWPNLKCYKV